MSSPTDAELDAAIVASCDTRFHKVAMVAARVMDLMPNQQADLLFDRIIARMKNLVRDGKLEAAGEVSRPRHSEIRLVGTSRQSG